jgi:hypothetical protein
MAHVGRAGAGSIPSVRICASGWRPIQLTGRRLLRELRERGYEGGYTAVTDALRE